MSKLEGKKIAIVCTEGFEEVELTKPKKALEDAGATVHIIAPEGKTSLKAWDEDKWSKSVDVDTSLDKAKPEDYHALMLPGGTLNADKLRTNKAAQKFAAHFFEKNKPVAAICHAPQLLINAELVQGKKMTWFHAVAADLKNAGADYVDEETVLDGMLLTSRNPDDIPAFNKAMIKLFAS